MKALPKFAVGEVVILQSKDNPELNGEDTVIEIINENEFSSDRVSGKITKHTRFRLGNIAYKLERVIVIGKDQYGDDCEAVWAESALRKKQEPGEMSFMQLMSSLNIEERV